VVPWTAIQNPATRGDGLLTERPQK
jgi:hypothetical protein